LIHLAKMEYFVAIMAAKAILMVLICFKYPATVLQPFSRSLYQFAFLGGLAKLLFFGPQAMEVQLFSVKVVDLLQDLSFIFPLVGVVITMGLDFLWALSREGESPIFANNISESDFVVKWYKLEVLFVVGLSAIRFFPTVFPIDVELVFQGCIQVVLYASFGFIWLCLLKVRGTSTQPSFVRAYNITWFVNLGCTGLVVGNTIGAAPLVTSVEENLAFFLFLQHCLETTGVSLIVAYFMFMKAPPADLREHAKTAATISGVLKAKNKFKALSGIHCKASLEEQEKLIVALDN